MQFAMKLVEHIYLHNGVTPRSCFNDLMAVPVMQYSFCPTDNSLRTEKV